MEHKLAQIVCNTPDGQRPCGLTPFLPLDEIPAELKTITSAGYHRQSTHTDLEIREPSGRKIDPADLPKTTLKPKPRGGKKD